jgi:hypothetical protein
MRTLRYYLWMLNMPRSEWFDLCWEAANKGYHDMYDYWRREVCHK